MIRQSATVTVTYNGLPALSPDKCALNVVYILTAFKILITNGLMPWENSIELKKKKKEAFLAFSVDTEHHINNSVQHQHIVIEFFELTVSQAFLKKNFISRGLHPTVVCVWPVSSTRLLLQIGVCVECWCCVQTTEELLFVQTRYGGSSTGQNNSPALYPAPLPSPQSRARARARASCPALIFWTGLVRILPAWLAWRCPPTWISCPSGQRGSREAVVGYFSALSSGRHPRLFLCHAILNLLIHFSF